MGPTHAALHEEMYSADHFLGCCAEVASVYTRLPNQPGTLVLEGATRTISNFSILLT